MSSELLQTTPITQLQHYLKHFISQPWNNRIRHRKYLSIWGPRYKGILVCYSPYAEQAALAVITRHYCRSCSRNTCNARLRSVSRSSITA